VLPFEVERHLTDRLKNEAIFDRLRLALALLYALQWL
jgi:hypothetical protein